MLNLTLEQVKAYAKEYKAVPVAKECLADMLTPLAFLNNVRCSSRNYFLLESIEGGEHWARYSFVGYDPVLRLKITDGNAEIISGAAVKYQEKDPLNCIRNILAEYKAPQIEGLPNFTGGLVGTFGFDFMRYCSAVSFSSASSSRSSAKSSSKVLPRRRVPAIGMLITLRPTTLSSVSGELPAISTSSLCRKTMYWEGLVVRK